ncbi:MAG: CapA family protein [Clostridia bacterium]|nr:CapA family protein [Clostridia bacterium]
MKRVRRLILWMLVATAMNAYTAAAASAGAYMVEDREEKIHSVTIAAVGDNLIHESIYKKAYDRKTDTYDFDPMYDPVRERISSYDIAVINQETVFVADRWQVSSYPRFGTPCEMGDAIVNAGFDIVLGATNHTWDKGEYGVNTMLRYWREHHPDITLLGIHESAEDYEAIDYIEINGIRLALFNYTYGTNGITVPRGKYYSVNLLSQMEKFLSDVREAENNADITLCFLHMGDEYRYAPNTFQVKYAKELIDAGADVLICSHPHVVEPYGTITTDKGNTGLVFFSCGNFISGQGTAPCLLGGLAEVTVTKTDGPQGSLTEVTSYDFIPVVTHKDQSGTRVFFLEDYTDELALTHSIREWNKEFCTDYLWDLWNGVMAMDW